MSDDAPIVKRVTKSYSSLNIQVYNLGTFLDIIWFLEEELGKTRFLHYCTGYFLKFNNPTMSCLEFVFLKVVSKIGF